MKNILLILLVLAFVQTSIASEKDKILSIAKQFKGNDMKARANRCLALGNYLLDNKSKDEILMLSEQPVRKVKGFSLDPVDKLDEESLQAYNDLFSSCQFEVAKLLIGACDDCTSIQRITSLMAIVSKVSSTEYFSNYIDMTGGMHLSRKFAVIKTDQPKSSEGRYATVLLDYGSGTYRKINGFESKQKVNLEIGYDRTSAILCRFNQVSSLLKKKYKGQFTCGWYLNDEDFSSSSTASLVCAPASDFTKDGKDKKRSLWIQKMDYQECK